MNNFFRKLWEVYKDMVVTRFLWVIFILFIVGVMAGLALLKIPAAYIGIIAFILMFLVSLSHRFYRYPQYFLSLTAVVSVIGVFSLINLLPQEFLRNIGLISGIKWLRPELIILILWALIWGIFTLIVIKLRKII